MSANVAPRRHPEKLHNSSAAVKGIVLHPMTKTLDMSRFVGEIPIVRTLGRQTRDFSSAEEQFRLAIGAIFIPLGFAKWRIF